MATIETTTNISANARKQSLQAIGWGAVAMHQLASLINWSNSKDAPQPSVTPWTALESSTATVVSTPTSTDSQEPVTPSSAPPVAATALPQTEQLTSVTTTNDAVPPQAQPDVEALDAERIAQQKLQEEKLQEEKRQAEKLNAEKLAQAQKAQEKLEQEKIAQQKLEQQRLAQLNLERQRLEQEKLAQEKLEQQALELKTLEQKKLEQARLAEKENQHQAIDDSKKTQPPVERLETPSKIVPELVKESPVPAATVATSPASRQMPQRVSVGVPKSQPIIAALPPAELSLPHQRPQASDASVDAYLTRLEQLVLQLNMELGRRAENAASDPIQELSQRVLDLNFENLALKEKLRMVTGGTHE